MGRPDACSKGAGVLKGSLLVSACGVIQAQEPRPGRYVIAHPAADEVQPMVMWVLDAATGDVTALRGYSRDRSVRQVQCERLTRADRDFCLAGPRWVAVK